jgi:signal transduction histidine kinase
MPSPTQKPEEHRNEARRVSIAASIRLRFMVTVVAVLILSLVAFGLLSERLRSEAIENAVQGKAHTLLELTAPSVARALWTLNANEVTALLEGLTADNDFYSASVITDYGQRYRVGQPPDADGKDTGRNLLTVTRSLYASNAVEGGRADQWLGDLTITLSKDALIDNLNARASEVVILVSLLVTLALGAVYLLLTRMVVVPIRTMLGGLGRVRAPDWVPLRWKRNDEFGQLISEFNTMVEQIRRHEERLEGARFAAEQGSRAKSYFVARMSHEMRTPLNVVIGFSDLLRTDPEANDTMREQAGEIYRSGQRLLRMVVDILEMAEFDAGTVKANDARVDLAPVIERAVALVRARRAEVGSRIVIDIAPDLPMIRGDAPRLCRMIEHLIDNAVKFSHAGSDVGVTAIADTAGGVRLSVSNHGQPFPPELSDWAMRPFEQADVSHTRRYEGAGLGLTLCMRYARLHDGRLTIHSEGGLTEVSFTLPPERTERRGGEAGPRQAIGAGMRG